MTDLSGNTIRAKLPGDTIPLANHLYLYVGLDGSTYYATDGDTAGNYYIDIRGSNGDCDEPGECPTLTPEEAFAKPPAATWP